MRAHDSDRLDERARGAGSTLARNTFARLRREDGAQLAEYALILSLVAILSIPLLGQIGSTVFSFFASYMSGLSGTP